MVKTCDVAPLSLTGLERGRKWGERKKRSLVGGGGGGGLGLQTIETEAQYSRDGGNTSRQNPPHSNPPSQLLPW